MRELNEWGREALEVNDAILRAVPGDEVAAVHRARCLRVLGGFSDAVETLDGVLTDHPENSVAVSQRRKARQQLEAARRARQLFTEDPKRLFESVETAKRAERDHYFQIEARRILARSSYEASGATASSLAAACALGAAQRKGRDLDGALQTYRWAWHQDDSHRTNAIAYIGLAGVLRDLGRLTDSEALHRAVLRADHRNRHAMRGLAGVLMDLAEKRGKRDVLPEVSRLLTAIRASGDQDPILAAMYGRLKSLS